MDAFKEREAAAEARYIHQIEADAAARIRRVRALGDWASRLMDATPEDRRRYGEILYALARSTNDDRIIVERVRDDVAAAGVSVSAARVAQVLEAAEVPS